MVSVKSDKIEYERRVRTVLNWILEGYLTKDILASSKAKWGIDDRMAYKYIKAARKDYAKDFEGEREERIRFYLTSKLQLFQKLKEKDTARAAAVADTILNSMAKLEGLLTDKVDVTTLGKEIPASQPVLQILPTRVVNGPELEDDPNLFADE